MVTERAQPCDLTALADVLARLETYPGFPEKGGEEIRVGLLVDEIIARASGNVMLHEMLVPLAPGPDSGAPRYDFPSPCLVDRRGLGDYVLSDTAVVTESRGRARAHRDVSRPSPSARGAAPPTISPTLVRRMREVRRSIHANPELSHHETATAALVRRELAGAGLTEIEPVAGTGVLVTIRGRRPGGVLALRADLDALPLSEASGVPFASRRPGVMHACGHDAHTAILIGVAMALHGERERLRGSVRCLFQPAEEAEPLGARQIVEQGSLEGVDAILALHVDPSLPVGQIGVRSGPLMASADSLRITIRGRSGHGALPHLGVDAIAAAAAVIQELQQIASRRIDPLEPMVLTIGKIEGGTAPNILADHVVLEGIVRTLDERLRVRLREMIQDVVAGATRAHGADGTVDVLPGEPVLRNDEALTELIRRAGREVLGQTAVLEIPRPELIAEDFAFYLEHVPGAMFRLGVRNAAKGIVHPLHHPAFALDEQALAVGAAVFLRAAWRFLETGTVEPARHRG